MENCTVATEFILEGFRDHPELQIILFMAFLVLYATTLVGNSSMIAFISANSNLHTPTYFFLCNLSFLDLCYSSVIAPKALVNFFTERQAISYAGCVAQLLLFSLFLTTEGFLLAVMAYGHFIAICYPLLYSIKMSRKSCQQLVAASHACGCANNVIQTSFSFQLRFCRSSQINHFFCDVPAVMKASIMDTHVNEVVMFTLCNIIIDIITMAIFASYAYILLTILKNRSAEGRYKAFSTCISHMTAVSLFYGTVFFIYAQPASISSPNQNKMVSMFYTLVIPMLNPLIYSLRNKDVKEALGNMMGKKSLFFVN